MRKKGNIFILFLGMAFANPLFAQTNEKDVAATADKYFKSGNYTEALPLYAQLLSNNATEVKYSYYYGVCRYMRGVNVGDAIAHLEKAAAKSAIPGDVNYYLARCYHLTYHFTEAITYYEKFKRIATPLQLQNFEIDLNIQMCRNAVNLPDKSDRYLINDKKIVDEGQFLTLYQLDPLRDGKILVMTDEYKSVADKKKNEKQYLFLDPSSSKLYFSSRGIDGEQSSDLMLSIKKIKKWDKATKLKEANSKYDEINPTAAKDGKIIYFSAKSPQSMGGFDIFKMEYNAESGTYGKPENVGAPVNSPFDDFLYASSNIERTNYVTSTRDCEKGKVCVIKFDENEPTDGYINIKGKFFNFDRPNEFNVNIIFYDQQNWKNLGEARVDSKTGEYSIRVPGAARYGCKIDVVGYSLLLGDFILRRDKKTVTQEIIINKQNNGQERLAIKNTYPEDATLLFAQLGTKEKLPSAKSGQAAATASLSKKEIKRENISLVNTIKDKSLVATTPVLQARKTVNWKEEYIQIAASLKPKEDKEVLAWAKEEEKNKSAVESRQRVSKKEDEPLFNLENVSFADLEAQPKKNKQPVADKLAKENEVKRSNLNITTASVKNVREITTLSPELPINKNAKRTGKSNYIDELPPIGYEVLDDSDKEKMTIIVSPLAENNVVKPTEPAKRSALKIAKAEVIKQQQLPVQANDLALKISKNRTGNVNFIAALPDDKEAVNISNLTLADSKSTKNLDVIIPSLNLAVVERTGKSNYIAALPAEKINEMAKVNDLAFAEARRTKQLELQQPQLKLAAADKTGKSNYIKLLPSIKPETEENIVAEGKTEEIKKVPAPNLISSKTITSLDNKHVQTATIADMNRAGKVNYIKSLPEPEVTRIQNAIATIERKEVSALYSVQKNQSLAGMSKAGRVKVKLPIEKVEEKEQVAQQAASKVKVVENNTATISSVKENRVEIAVVELAPATPRETDVASLRYRFRAFENKSDSQVREIIGRTSNGGLGQ